MILRLAAVPLILATALQAQKANDKSVLNVSLPEKSWALQIDVPSFVVKVDESKSSRRRYLLAENTRTGVTLSVTLEQVRGSATLDDCRKVFRQRNKGNEPLKPTDLKESQVGDMAISEFTFDVIEGIKIRQRNVFACMPKEDVYIDIHVSKVEYTPKDQPLFTAILQAVRITETAPPANGQADSTSYMREGSRYFLEQKFDKAIGPYQKAFDLEKSDRKLEPALWRVLVDNLGMAYGITGNLKSAEDVLQYGISKDPTYPMFYYNLACTYAERNDLDNTIKYLKTAFEYKQNMLPGEQIPNPAKDDSFQRFMQNEKFRKLIEFL